MKQSKQPPATTLALRWIADIQTHIGTTIVNPEHRAALGALAEDYLRLQRLADKCEKSHGARSVGRPALNGTAQSSTERNKRSREAKERIIAPYKARIAGLKAEIAELRKQQKGKQ